MISKVIGPLTSAFRSRFMAIHHIVIPILCGLIFVAVFWGEYKGLPDRLYAYRDDGVITLSHGKNLAVAGTIGVSASGERIEASSSPLQMMVYYVFYKIGKIGFKKYSRVQTYVSTFFMGFIFGCLFLFRPGLAPFGALGAAVLLSKTFAFIGWHGSGMENALTHVLFLSCLYLLYLMLKNRQILYRYVPVFVLASVSRVDAIGNVGAMVLVFALMFALYPGIYRSEGRRLNRSQGFRFLAVFFAGWCVLQLVRIAYFGHFFPNTASAQSIDFFGRLKALLSFDAEIYKRGFNTLEAVVNKLHGRIPILMLPFLLFVRRTPLFLSVFFLLFSCLFVVWCTPFVFGPARLDNARTMTQLTLWSVVLGFWIIANFERPRHWWWSLPLTVLICLLELKSPRSHRPYYLCCDTKAIETGALRDLNDLEKTHELFRPTVAIADLGVVSWQKKFNIVDMAFLGSQIVAALKQEPHAIADYFLEFAAPDSVHIHKSWACKHQQIQIDPRFAENYDTIRATRDKWLRSHCRKHKDVKTGVWFRKDVKKGAPSKERRLIDALRGGIRGDLIKAALEECKKEDSVTACQYVTRTVYRFLPEFEEAGLLDEFETLFSTTKTAQYDLAILRSRRDGRWHDDATDAIRKYTAMRMARLQSAAASPSPEDPQENSHEN